MELIALLCRNLVCINGACTAELSSSLPPIDIDECMDMDAVLFVPVLASEYFPLCFFNLLMRFHIR